MQRQSYNANANIFSVKMVYFSIFPLKKKKKQSRIDTHATIERIQFFKYNHAKKNWILWRAFKQKQQKLMEKNRI